MGAYLTQNTAWTNVEKALGNLRAARIAQRKRHSPSAADGTRAADSSLRVFPPESKATETFIAYLDQALQRLFERIVLRGLRDELREELLNLNGVGPETADSILLYAGNHPVFVVDAYTRRILDRHEILSEDATYEEIRQLFERALVLSGRSAEASAENRNSPFGDGISRRCTPPSAMSTAKRTALTQVYNEMHGLIVGVGKNYCRKSQPHCDQCPLQKFLPAM